ncbi:MAG: hypothetical protein K9N55_03575 [Phycisphaerae bacterium]|nr:hypothetical protein [Phycisphaerae bacterium]
MPVHDKHVLVLHGPLHQVWTEVFNALAHEGWTLHRCDSDLLLVSQLGQVSGTLVLCVGSIESLCARPGRLLGWLRHRGVTCCAWATRSSSWEMIEQVQAIGVPVFTRIEAFNAWVGRLECVLPGRAAESGPGTHTVSDAELALLFGDEGDA